MEFIKELQFHLIFSLDLFEIINYTFIVRLIYLNLKDFEEFYTQTSAIKTGSRYIKNNI